jgi:hypothetical protein
MFHCSFTANCISLLNIKNYLLALLTCWLLLWSYILICGWVMLHNINWYIVNTSVDLSRNDTIVLIVSVVLFVWGSLITKRLRLLRLLTKLQIVIVAWHIKSSYNIELQMVNHDALEALLTISLSLFIVPMYTFV